MSATLLVLVVAAATATLRLAPMLRGRRSQQPSSAPLLAASLGALVASGLNAPSPGLTLTSQLLGILAAGLVARRRKSLTTAVAAGLAVGWAASLLP